MGIELFGPERADGLLRLWRRRGAQRSVALIPEPEAEAAVSEISKICVSDVRERRIVGHTDFRNEVLATFGAGTFRWGALRPL